MKVYFHFRASDSEKLVYVGIYSLQTGCPLEFSRQKEKIGGQ